MATQEKNRNMTMMSMEEALAEFDGEVARLEREIEELNEHVNSGKTALGIPFYR